MSRTAWVLTLPFLLAGCAPERAHLYSHAPELVPVPGYGVTSRHDDSFDPLIAPPGPPAYNADDHARRLLVDAWGAKGAALPIRRDTLVQKLEKKPLDTVAGFNWQPSYYHLSGHNALILIHAGRPPTLLPIDPDKPIADPYPPTSEAAWTLWHREVQRDLEALRRVRPPAP